MLKFIRKVKNVNPLKACPFHDWCQEFITDLERKAYTGPRIAQTMERNRDLHKEAVLKYIQTKDERYYCKIERLDKEYVEVKSFLRAEENNQISVALSNINTFRLAKAAGDNNKN